MATPAAREFLGHLDAGRPRQALEVLDEHWAELWYALDPADLKEVLLTLPDEANQGLRNAAYLNALVGVPVRADTAELPTEGPQQRLERIGQQVADLRLAGRPAEALRLGQTIAHDALALRGRFIDTSGGRHAVWLVQAGITALLAGDLTLARTSFLAATTPHRHDRFPFVTREALAKLALTHALRGEPTEARACLRRAEEQPRTASWVETMIDDSVRLTRYLCAIDALELEQAEEMRLADPSPFSHLEFWGVALQAQVRHLSLTGRRAQARELCEEVARAGLPLPGSDGWLARALADARLQCAPLHVAQSEEEPGSPAEATLARRLHLLSTGQFGDLTTRDRAERSVGIPARTRLGLDLVRGQGLLHSGRYDDGRRVILETLAEAFDRGTLGVLRFLTEATLAAIGDTEIGARARQLVDAHGVCLVEVTELLRSPLSAAEEKAMRMLADGMSRAEIAEASYISLETVKSQLRSAYRKLGVGKRADAIAAFERLDG